MTGSRRGWRTGTTRTGRPWKTWTGTREDAALPLSDREVALALRAAEGWAWNLRAATADRREGMGGASEVSASTFETNLDTAYPSELLRFLLFTGMHISRVPRTPPTALSKDGKGGLTLAWRRPKPRATRVLIPAIPVPAPYITWVDRFLRKKKPMTNWAYGFFFQRLSQRVETLFGEKVHYNSLRWRHTAFVWMKHRMGLTDQEVADFAGCSITTVQKYASSRPEALAPHMRERGWDHLVEDVLEEQSVEVERKS